MRRFLSGMAGLVLLVAASAPAAEWTQFRGPQGQGIASDTGLPVKWSATENVVWKTPLPGAGTSSPIFVGNRIYLTSYTGFNVPGEPGDMQQLKRHVLCLDRSSGKLLWSKNVPSKLPEQERIRDDHGYASSTLASDGERLYGFFGKSGAFAFDLDGNQIWQADCGSELNGWGSSNSPVLFEDLVIINASIESKSLIALEKKTGKERWRARGINESWNTPLLVTNRKQTECVVAIFEKVLSFNAKTGEKLWTCDTGIRWYMVPSLVSHKDVVYCIGGRGGGGTLAIRTGGSGDVTGTHRLWTGKKASNVSSPIFLDGHLYWASDNLGIVYCAKADSGEIVYEERLPRAGQFYASPVLADGKLYYVTRDGKTFVVAARPTFELLATNQIGDRGDTFNASPVVADGRLFLRSNRFLYCLDGK